MAWTVGNSNYAGGVVEVLYKILGVGNQVVQQGSAALETGIALKRSLPNLSQTDNPIGDYTSGVPSSSTATTTYAERELEPKKMTIYEPFLPEDWQEVWDKWQPTGDFTNLMMNPEFVADVLEIYRNKGGAQLAANFWQGDTTLAAGNALNKFNGIITRAAADADVVDVANIGAITKANVVEVLEGMYSATLDKFMNNPDFIYHMNTTDFKLLQLYNNDAKKTTVGVLTENVQNLFLEKRIRHYTGLPKNSVVGAVSTTDRRDTNLFMGMYFDPVLETPKMGLKDNAGRTHFVRFDYKVDANYRVGSEIVLYQGS